MAVVDILLGIAIAWLWWSGTNGLAFFRSATVRPEDWLLVAAIGLCALLLIVGGIGLAGGKAGIARLAEAASAVGIVAGVVLIYEALSLQEIEKLATLPGIAIGLIVIFGCALLWWGNWSARDSIGWDL